MHGKVCMGICVHEKVCAWEYVCMGRVLIYHGFQCPEVDRILLGLKGNTPIGLKVHCPIPCNVSSSLHHHYITTGVHDCVKQTSFTTSETRSFQEVAGNCHSGMWCGVCKLRCGVCKLRCHFAYSTLLCM